LKCVSWRKATKMGTAHS